MNPLLGVAIFIFLWWLCFFLMLPIGAQSSHEAGEEVPTGFEAGAPRFHNLGKKALWAAGIAAIAWLGVAWGISQDVFQMRG
jgi:predicted secreted protein